jgi:hypothetical protein
MILIETVNNTELLVENTAEGKQLYIEGCFMQSEVKNRNGRIYPKAVLEQAVDSYINNFVKERRAIGELNHPADRAQADPAEAAILIESLYWNGNDVIGKAKVLSTPKGQIVKGLLEGGWKAGVSSRATGSVKTISGTPIVQPDLKLWAVDVVDGPSAPDAFVKQLYEQQEHFSKHLLEFIKTIKL